MKKLAILISILVTLSLIIPLAACSSSSSTTSAPAQTAKVLRLAVPWPVGDPVTNQIQKFLDNFNAKAAGRYVIELHPSESLVKTADSMDALRTGAVEMAGWPVGVFASNDARYAAAEIPFLVNNVQADAAMQVKTMPLYDSFQETKFNSKPLFSFTCLALDIISTKPIKVASDWNGLLCQSVSPQSAKFIGAMGGSAVPLDFPEAYQALQKGTVTASTQSSSLDIMFKLNEVAKYITRGYLIPAAIMISINVDTYKAMPQDLQTAIVQTGLQAQTDANTFFIATDKTNNDTLTGMGINVYALPKDERDRWMKMVKPASDSLLQAMPADFAAQVKAAADQVNASNPYSY
ncbi:MAG TPA: TRAP transporter substrate-binding protein DctP [Dehalococcoidales bacterium]